MQSVGNQGVENSGQRVNLYFSFLGRFSQLFWFETCLRFEINRLVPQVKKLFSLQTSLLCIVGELAGGGSVAVAVIVSER